LNLVGLGTQWEAGIGAKDAQDGSGDCGQMRQPLR
jgi:hypothetical protein